MEHTKGPWTIEHGTIDRRLVFSGSIAVAELHAVNAEANARLIAAAPEMLQALKNIVASEPITNKGLPLALQIDIQSARNLILKLEAK